MKLAILTTLWNDSPERLRLSRIVLRYYQQLKVPGVELKLWAVVSQVTDAKLAASYGFGTSVAPNGNLSVKWAAGCKALQGSGVDAVVIAGSDDLLSVGYLDFLEEAFSERARYGKDADYVIPRSCYLYDAPTGRACYLYRLRACGAGRAFSARLLDRVDWNAWDDDSGKHAWMPVAAQERAVMPFVDTALMVDPMRLGMPIVDVKCGDNLNSFDDSAARAETLSVDGQKLLREYFPTVAEEVIQWQ